jgi:hypothetical protein
MSRQGKASDKEVALMKKFVMNQAKSPLLNADSNRAKQPRFKSSKQYVSTYHLCL